MLPSLLVAVTVSAPGAPIPRDILPNTTGPAPRVLAVKADANGMIWITANVFEKRKVTQNYIVIENGKQSVKQRVIEQTVPNYIRKQVGDFGGKFATANGNLLTTDEATKRLKDGATLLASADGKPIDKGWLKAVADDTVIMTTEGLAAAHFVYGPPNYPSTPAPRLARLTTDSKGDVRLAVNANLNASGPNYQEQLVAGGVVRGRMIVQGNVVFADAGGASFPAPTPPGPDGKKALSDLKFDAYDLTGERVHRTEVLKRLAAGGLVIIAGDNRFPDPDYLKAFRGDLLVLTSVELTFPAGVPNPYDYSAPKPATTTGPTVPQPRPALQVQPLPAIRLNAAGINRVPLPVGK